MEKTPTGFHSEQASGENSQWFVLRDITRPNAMLPGYKLLEKEDIQSFTPMHFVIKKKDGRNIRIQEPVIRNLVFAYTSKELLDTITSKYKTLQYRYLYGHSINDPMVVPKEDMDRFIYAVESSYSEPVYYSPEDITPDKYGKEVRIIGGRFDGYTGHLLKMQGSRVKRLLVELQGIFIAGVEVDAEYIKFV